LIFFLYFSLLNFQNLARVEAVEARWERRVATGGYVEVRRGRGACDCWQSGFGRILSDFERF
jgi:hypothetical protein